MAGTARIVLVVLAAVVGGALIATSLLRDRSSGSVAPQPRNWSEVLRADPAITVVPCPTGAPPPGQEASICIAGMPAFGTSPAISDPLQGGYIDPDVVYADLDGDGVAEAVLRVWGSGVASVTGFLVFREAQPQPKLLAAVPGYRTGLTPAPFDAGNGRTGTTLIQTQPIYADGDPTCCPTSREYIAWTLRGDVLTVVDRKALRIKP